MPNLQGHNNINEHNQLVEHEETILLTIMVWYLNVSYVSRLILVPNIIKTNKITHTNQIETHNVRIQV